MVCNLYTTKMGKKTREIGLGTKLFQLVIETFKINASINAYDVDRG